MCVCLCVCDYVQRVSEKFFILRSMERDIFINVHRSSCKVRAVIVTFQHYMNFLNTFSKNPEVSDFMKIRPVGAELFHADGRTDMTKLIVAFRYFVEAPKQRLLSSARTRTVSAAFLKISIGYLSVVSRIEHRDGDAKQTQLVLSS